MQVEKKKAKKLQLRIAITYRSVLVRVHSHPARRIKTPTLTGNHFNRRQNRMHPSVRPYGMLMKVSMGMVPPPQIHTVKKTIRRVVENIIWRA